MDAAELVVDLGSHPSGRTLAMGSGVAAILFGVTSLGPPNAGVVAGCMLVALSCTPLLWRLRVDRVDGPGIYALMSLLTLGLTSLAWLGQPSQPGPGLTAEDVTSGLVVAAGGMFAFVLGSVIHRVGRRRMMVGGLPGAPPLLFVGVFAAATAVALVAVAAGAYGFTGTQERVDRLGWVGPATPFFAQLTRIVLLCLALEWLRTGRSGLGRLLVGLLAVQFIVGLLTGMKSESLYPIVLVGLAFLAHRGWTSGRLTVLLGITVLFVLLPASQAFRASTRGDDRASFGSVARSMGERIVRRPDLTLADGAEYFAGRFRNIDNLALIVRDTPDVYARGDPTLYMLIPALVLVPRAFWPDKPVLDTGGQFARTYWQIPPSIRTANPTTQVGDLYRTFGLLGVALGLFGLGMLVSWWSSWSRSGRSPRIEALYLYTVGVAVTSVESDLPNLLVTTAKSLPFAAAVAWLLLPGSGSPAGSALLRRGAVSCAHQLRRP